MGFLLLFAVVIAFSSQTGNLDRVDIECAQHQRRRMEANAPPRAPVGVQKSEAR